jgi:8-oxo-dGTP pyrophosphatase MutT (NUDIX family)
VVLPTRSPASSPTAMAPDPQTDPVPPREAAAAIVLRDAPAGLQVLLGQRSTASRFMPGFWVFPGGRLESADGAGDARWRTAAAREVAEEVGLDLPVESLVPFDRWVTPQGLPLRFDTVFFLATATDEPPAVDGHEIVDARWETPQRLLDAAEDGMPVLVFPTLHQLRRLAAFATVAEARAACRDELPAAIVTTVRLVDDLPAMVIAGPDGRTRRFRTGAISANELAPGFRSRTTTRVDGDDRR